MAIPLHTFEPTGDPCVDDELYIPQGKHPIVDEEAWFNRNHFVLSHTPAKVLREAVRFMDVERAPQRAGVYFLVKQDVIVYIGKSNNIYKRLDRHWWDGKSFDRYWCFGGVPIAWLERVEAYYIRKFKPPLNRAGFNGNNPLFNKIVKKHRQTWKVNEMIETGELVLPR